MNAFMSAFLSDVSAALPNEWQCVDIAATALKIALRGKGMQKQPATVAALQSCLNTLTTLLSARRSGQGPTGASGAQSASGSDNTGDNTSPDADSQPGAPGESGDGEGG